MEGNLAEDDDTIGDDEDGVSINWNDSVISTVLAPNQLIPGESTTLDVAIGDEPGYLYAWIDLERDGDFTGSVAGSWDEYLVQGVQVNANTTHTIDLFVPRYDESGNAIEPGSVYARFRIISEAEYARRTDPVDGDPAWADPANSISFVETIAYSGEVEDYLFQTVEVDYGDADIGPTLWADDGARHVSQFGPSMTIGTATDWEPDGQPNTGATGDDDDGTDDEDGAQILDILGQLTTELIPGEWNTLQITLDVHFRWQRLSLCLDRLRRRAAIGTAPVPIPTPTMPPRPGMRRSSRLSL